jgi:hypothetical protein
MKFTLKLEATGSFETSVSTYLLSYALAFPKPELTLTHVMCSILNRGTLVRHVPTARHFVHRTVIFLQHQFSSEVRSILTIGLGPALELVMKKNSPIN